MEDTAFASDEGQLASRIRADGGVLIHARSQNAGKAQTAQISRRERICLTNHLHTSTATGIPILEALRSYAEQVEEPGLAQALNSMAAGIEGGQGIGEAMKRFPNLFPPLYVNMVAAGEESGKLDTILGQLGEYLEWRDEVAKDLRQATVYPTAMLTLVAALVVFLLSFVLPRFVGIFEGNAEALPLAAVMLMGIGSLFSVYWPWLLATAMGGTFAFLLARRNEHGALWLDRMALKVPLFGHSIRLICLSQLTYSLGLLLSSGIDITRSLVISKGVAGNRHLIKNMERVEEMVAAGHGINEAFKTTRMFPPLVMQMVSVGEETGHLPKSMERATFYMKDEVKNGLKLAFAILEPAITVFLGVVVGGIALTIFYTLYTMVMAIGGGH